MANVRHQRIMQLEQRGHNFRGIGKFAEWLQGNKSRFRGNVYGPVVAEVNVADKHHALILEQAVGCESGPSAFTSKHACIQVSRQSECSCRALWQLQLHCAVVREHETVWNAACQAPTLPQHAYC